MDIGCHHLIVRGVLQDKRSLLFCVLVSLQSISVQHALHFLVIYDMFSVEQEDFPEVHLLNYREVVRDLVGHGLF